MGFEIPIDVGFPRNRKCLELKVRLHDHQADVWPMRLLFWAAENARDGVIRASRGMVEDALGWRGRRGRLYAALISTRWIEKDGKTIHDWMSGIGRALAIYELKKAKQRERYAQGIGHFSSSTGDVRPKNNSGDLPEEFHLSGISGISGKPGKPGGDGSPPYQASPPPDHPTDEAALVRADLLAAGVSYSSDAQLDSQARQLVAAFGAEKLRAAAQDPAKPLAGLDVLKVGEILRGRGKPSVRCARCQDRGEYSERVTNADRVAEVRLVKCDCGGRT